MFSLPRIVARCLLTLVIVLAVQQAHAMQCRWAEGGQTLKTDIPFDLVIPSSARNGAVVWESAPIIGLFHCWGGNEFDNVNFWLNPENAPHAGGVSFGLRYKGRVTESLGEGGKTRVETDKYIGTEAQTFRLDYSIVLIRRGRIPERGWAAFDTLDLFQLDGAQGVTNSGSRFRHQLYGPAFFSNGGTCAIAAGHANQSIALPRINPQSLPHIGSTTGRVHFQINLNNCSDAVSSARFIFSGTPASDNAWFFSNTGSATGIALRLAENNSQQTISPASANNNVEVSVVNRQAVLPLVAEYVRTGAVTPGSLSSRTTLMITYN